MRFLLFAAALLICNVAIANETKFTALATGAQEVPENDSTATAKVRATFDEGFTKVDVQISIDGIFSSILAAHFHCSHAGANGPVAFGIFSPGPLNQLLPGKTKFTLTNADAMVDCTPVIDRPANNIAALAQAMKEGLIYFNLHTSDHPPGEVRGHMIVAK